jgi:hypothetical protein
MCVCVWGGGGCEESPCVEIHNNLVTPSVCVCVCGVCFVWKFRQPNIRVMLGLAIGAWAEM